VVVRHGETSWNASRIIQVITIAYCRHVLVIGFGACYVFVVEKVSRLTMWESAS
jgi:hypothetical protein